MRRNLVRTMAMLLATTMVSGGTMTAFAADTDPTEGNVTSTGKVEGIVVTDVFDIDVPTVTEDTYAFILDPQGLIAATTNAAYSGKTFESGASLFFNNIAATKTTDYSSTSDAGVIKNYSTTKVDVTVTAEVTDKAGIALTEDNTFANDKTASMYLALTDGTQTDAVNPTELKATLTKTVDAIDKDAAYEVKYDASNGYSYELKADLTSVTIPEYSFNLTGKANTADVWTETLETAAPKVKVTWTIESYKGQAPVFEAGTNLGEIKITSEGDGQNALASITSITMVNDKGTAFDGYKAYQTLWTDATTVGNVITFDTKYVAYYKEATTEATITYVTVGGETKTATVDVITATN